MKKLLMMFVVMISSLVLGACGSNSSTSESGGDSNTSQETETADNNESEETTEGVSLTIGSAPTTTKAVEALVPELESAGYTVEVLPFEDYVQPNVALDEGSIDANIIQHQPYLDSYNESNGTNLVWMEDVLLGFTGLFSNKHENIDDLPEGAQIGMFQDASNQDRALRILESEGLVTVEDADGNGLYNLLEVVDNKKNFEFVQMDIPQLTTTLNDTDASFVPAVNFVIAEQTPEHTLAMESVNTTSINFALGLVVNEDNTDAEWIQDIVEAFKSEDVQAAIQDYYGDALTVVVE